MTAAVAEAEGLPIASPDTVVDGIGAQRVSADAERRSGEPLSNPSDANEPVSHGW